MSIASPAGSPEKWPLHLPDFDLILRHVSEASGFDLWGSVIARIDALG
jgi:hypothetical protein